MTEAAFVVLLQAAGIPVLLGFRRGLPWGFILAASFPVGLASFTIAVVLLLLSPLPVTVPAALAVLAALAAGSCLVLRRNVRLSWAEAGGGAAVCAVGLAVSLATQWANATMLSNDSWFLVRHAAVLGSTGSLSAVDPELLLAFPVLVPITQFPATAWGGYHIASVFTMTTLSGLAVLAWAVMHTARLWQTPRLASLVVTACAVALPATTYFIVWQTFYVNGHLLVGVLFLVLCVSLWLGGVTGHWSWAAPAAVVVPALLLARLEAPLMIGLALVALISTTRWPTAVKAAVVAPYVLVGAVWYGVVVRYGGDGHILTNTTALLMTGLIVGVGVLLAAERVAPLRPLVRRGPVICVAGLVVALVGAVVLKPEHMTESLVAFATNVLQQGLWGPFWIVLLPLLLVLVSGRRVPWERMLVTPIGGTILLILVLVALRNPYRLGWGDSGNRMLTHVSFLAVFFVAVKCLELLRRRDRREPLAHAHSEAAPALEGERATGERVIM